MPRVSGVVKRAAVSRLVKAGIVPVVTASLCAREGTGVAAIASESVEYLNAEQKLREQIYALDQHAIVATTDVHGTITYANDKFCAISGYSRDELLGQNHRILNSGYHPGEFFQQMYHTIANGQVWHGEIRNRAKDGSVYWVAATIVPFLDAEGKPRQYMAIRTDITESKRSEEVRGLLAAVVDSSDDAIICKTLDGTITAWNRGAEKVFGYPASEAVGQPMLTLFPPNRMNEESDILARIERGESIEHFETVRRRKDGRLIDVSATISPIRDGAGKVVGASKIARDITARKQAEKLLAEQAEELSRKAAELARSNSDLEQFAYVASHDLQEPLRMVTAYTQLLAERYRGRLDENADKFIGYASEGALRMQVLIQDLLAFSRVGRNEATTGSVDCNAVMKEVLQALSPAIQESGAVVTSEELPTVWADRTQLAQVVQNLIGNAIKFRGQERPVVSVRAEKVGDHWLFSVQDNGIGIAPEHAENIFVVFQRLHTRTAYPGNGIGLAICKKIVERGGGKIWVESRAGSGSTFKFTMPLLGSGSGF
jgi:PAS domain S-box-containing protein